VFSSLGFYASASVAVVWGWRFGTQEDVLLVFEIYFNRV
jgi:hypothetical protein